MSKSLPQTVFEMTGNPKVIFCPEFARPFFIKAINQLFTFHLPVTSKDEIALEYIDSQHSRVYVRDNPEHIMICEL